MTFLDKVARYLKKFLIDPLSVRSANDYVKPNAASQLMLKFFYQQLANSEKKLPLLNDVGFKAYSQSDEDGILLFIFSIIGTKNKRCVELCAGDGIECNTANLIINHGWTGLLADGNLKLVQRGRRFYGNHKATYVYPPTFVHSIITRSNVNEILKRNGFIGEVDLLSIDVDGMDYWLWKSTDIIDPRVVVLEYLDIVGPERSLTVPYKDNFNAYKYPKTNGMPNFFGASLPAFVKLGREKGYRLVGCNRYGYNAFFIRRDIGEKELPEISIHDCFKHPKVIWGMKERFPTVKDFPWVEV